MSRADKKITFIKSYSQRRENDGCCEHDFGKLTCYDDTSALVRVAWSPCGWTNRYVKRSDKEDWITGEAIVWADAIDRTQQALVRWAAVLEIVRREELERQNREIVFFSFFFREKKVIADKGR